MKTTFRIFAGILLLTLTPLATSATSAPISSKLEEAGKMNNMEVTDLRTVKRDNLIHIQAEVTNTSSSNQQLYYRFRWLDRDGFTVWDDEPWKPLTIYGNQKQTINAVSPTFKATDFRLVLQSPNSTPTNKN